MDVLKEKLRDFFANYPKSAWSGTAYCHRFGNYPPDKVNHVGARWNPKDITAIYFSLNRDTAIAEGGYAVQSAAIPMRTDVKRTLYKVEFKLNAVITLPLDKLEGHFSIRREDLLAGGWEISQMIGDLVDYLDCDGLIVPSARAAGNNIVVFNQHVAVDWELRILDTQDLSATT